MAVPALASTKDGNDPTGDAAWAKHLLAWQRGVLRHLARGAPLHQVLESLCAFGEERAPGRLFSVLVYDADQQRLRHGAGPSLPKAYNDAIDGLPVGPDTGSCGTAAYERRQVIVEDIASDPKWAAFRDLAKEHGLAACWSTPILATDGRLLGTWAVYQRTTGGPTRADLQLIEAATELAAIALEREQDEAALREARAEAAAQEAWLRRLFEQFPGPLAMFRGAEATELRFAFVNPRYVQLVGKTDLLGQRLRDAFPELIATGAFDTVENAFRTGITQTGHEFFVPLPVGEGKTRPAWFNFVVEPIRNARGVVEGVVSTGYEVTEQVQARHRVEELLQQLRASEDRLRLAVDATRLATWDHDPATGTVLWNARGSELLGLPAEATTMATLLERVHPEDRAEVEAEMRTALDPRSGGRYGGEFRLVLAEGQVRWVEVRGQAFFHEGGTPTRFIGTALDITARKEAERELRQANQRLQQLGRMKTEFLNMASHELRTPLTPLVLRLQMLARNAENLGERQRRDLAVVLRNADRLSDLVTDVLEVARLESGRFPFRRESFDLAQSVTELVQTFEPVAREKGVRLVVQGSRPLPLQADGNRVGQVVTNLLDNAIKYTPAGGTVTLTTADRGHDVVLEVRDTGPGLTAEQQERLFEPFTRVHEGVDAGPPGSGLGLFIARTIVEQHGGRIAVRSDGAGQGAVFTVTLPKAPPAGAGEVGR